MFSHLNQRNARVWAKVPDNIKDFDSEMARIGGRKREGCYVFSPGRWAENPMKKQAIIVRLSDNLKLFSVFYMRYENDRELKHFLKALPRSRKYPVNSLWELFYHAYFEGQEEIEKEYFYIPKEEYLGLFCA